MPEIKWVKLSTDLIQNPKIVRLRSLPRGNDMVLIWIMLISKAGRCNEDGELWLAPNFPYTPEILANELGFPAKTMKTAIEEFRKLGMVTVGGDGLISLPGWAEHQNIDGMEKIREQARDRKRRQRDKSRQSVEDTPSNKDSVSQDVSRDSHVTVTQCHATEEDKEERLKNKTKESEVRSKEEAKEEMLSATSDDESTEVSGYDRSGEIREAVRAWNDLEIPGVEQILSLKDSQRQGIQNLLETFSLYDVLMAVGEIQNSAFLRGEKSNFRITFNWFIRPENFQKVLSGKYA